MAPKESSVIIDPVAMNIANRIATGSIVKGETEYEGGLLIQGQHHGKLTIHGGPLVVFDGAYITGEIMVEGQTFIFGQVGGHEGDSLQTTLTSMDTLHLTNKALAYGKLRFVRIATYDGAQIHATLETIKPPPKPAQESSQ